jgi:phenylpyruvate tautomerase PptA (4-oxalocrotonate tautomerase family)
MPLWKVYHPAGAFTAEDKRDLAKRVTEVYASIPIPKFYVVFIYEEIAKDSCFVVGEPHNKFVRFKIDQIARTLPGLILRGMVGEDARYRHRSVRQGERLRLGSVDRRNPL